MQPKAAVSFTEKLKRAIAGDRTPEVLGRPTPGHMTTAGNDAIAIASVDMLEVSTSAAERIGYILLLNIGVC